MYLTRRLRSSCLAAGLATLATAVAAAGQAPTARPLSRTQFGVGYVANAPDALLGGSFYMLLPRRGGIGLYIDAKFDAADPSGERGYDARYTSRQVAEEVAGATFIKTEGSWKSFNVAVMRPLTPSLVAYAGGGVARGTKYDLYNINREFGIGQGGVAWVESPESAETRANIMAGIMMRVSARLTSQFGYETQPNGVTAGVSLRLPAW